MDENKPKRIDEMSPEDFKAALREMAENGISYYGDFDSPLEFYTSDAEGKLKVVE